MRFRDWNGARVLGGVMLMLACVGMRAQSRTMEISKRYLNIPVANAGAEKVFHIKVDGVEQREFPVQLAEGKADYWIFLDVSEFKGQTIVVSGDASQAALDRMVASDKIEGEDTLYKESGRPAFHFTVKRGWNNDVNGPIFTRGQYHLFWQAYPFGVKWDSGFMYWGHAVSKDLVHWKELAPALRMDGLGAAWSGSSFVDHDNVGGWGKDALVLVYTAFDRATKKQVQCIAYSTDGGVTFTHYAGNPVVDSGKEVGSTDTRDPHVFWYAPTKHWVMVLFEKDGMSIFTSTDLKAWTRKSHFKGLWECPDLFELAVDGDAKKTRWVLHGGSSSYFVGSFDGETFTPETGELRYAEGKNLEGDDTLYASQSFAEMPDGRRVQMAWGRVKLEGMPFSQMLLFPTEFKLVTTKEGVRLRAVPIAEIARLRGREQTGMRLTVGAANRMLEEAGDAGLDVKAEVTLGKGDALSVRYAGKVIASVDAGELEGGRGSVEVLVDKGVAEIFVNGGERYVVRELPLGGGGVGLTFGMKEASSVVDRLEVWQMKSMWAGADDGALRGRRESKN